MTMKNNRIYIAGPMTGKTGYNFAAFFAAEKYLLERGFEVVNPAKIIIGLFGEKEKYAPNEIDIVINVELAVIHTCSCIYLLRGWETSAGSQVELRTAINGGLKIEVEDIFTPDEIDAIRKMARISELHQANNILVKCAKILKEGQRV